MSTPNLAIVHVAAAQNQKEVTVNTALDNFDTALTGVVTEAMPDLHFVLPTADALQNMVFIFTGALTLGRGVTLPPNKKLYIVSNQTTGAGSPAGSRWSLTFGTASSPTGRVAVVE